MKRIPLSLACAFFALYLAAFACADDLKIVFGGCEWIVRRTSRLEGPGPNYFSSRSVRLSGCGLLLAAKERKPFLSKSRYESAEIISSETFSYGTFELDFAREDRLDSRAVFGFFLYDGDNPPDFSEVDFEIARWDVPENTEGQFTVQPGDVPGQSFSFPLPAGAGAYTARIVWRRERIDFSLFSRDGQDIGRWSYAGKSLPLSNLGVEKVRVHANFWLFRGALPAGDGAISVMLTGFRYLPENASGD